jgi:hypothetical protein
MTQQTGYRPGEDGVATNAKDRLSEMADTATDTLKDVAESAQDMAGKVADQPTRLRRAGAGRRQAGKAFC